MTANEDRGEISVMLDGAEFVMRPSYSAIVAFEVSTGKSVMALAKAAGSDTLTVPEAAEIVTECIKAWGEATKNTSAQGVNAKRIGELILEEGFMLVLKRLELLLYMAVTGGYTAAGELKVVTTMTPTSPGATSQESQSRRSAGGRKTSGTRPR